MDQLQILEKRKNYKLMFLDDHKYIYSDGTVELERKILFC